MASTLESSLDLKEFALKILDDKKAEQVVTIDLKGKSSIADYLLIATGNSGRQVGALAENLHREFKGIGIQSRVEGIPQCDWVIVDAGDIIVHVFRPEVRSFYNLEKMWGVEVPVAAAKFE
ncbi:ribosome silencing factor [Candidatus Odyssella acanthamoebae]|uniref:Ribosomal silencing factor RsfS n=1 Tax=Candidatus Odyssella acanthamoebae TaxID=91604 RepID=A0A077ARA6_9PROT|nr:ribosome silencing factor [Candidatus Paracaedibacter acanthamoebae]AIK95717.1 ribosome-associated protein IOJAP [Candidatus Paracaedibacter acanthamoebae]